ARASTSGGRSTCQRVPKARPEIRMRSAVPARAIDGVIASPARPPSPTSISRLVVMILDPEIVVEDTVGLDAAFVEHRIYRLDHQRRAAQVIFAFFRRQMILETAAED